MRIRSGNRTNGVEPGNGAMARAASSTRFSVKWTMCCGLNFFHAPDVGGVGCICPTPMMTEPARERATCSAACTKGQQAACDWIAGDLRRCLARQLHWFDAYPIPQLAALIQHGPGRAQAGRFRFRRLL
jgi:hypothetical protein